jgi:transcription-repair coupling factor (superfamily II helicase)
MERPTPPAAVGRLVAARALKELAQTLQEKQTVAASGLWGSSVAAVTAALERELRRPILLVCGHIDETDDLADDLELFHGRRPEVLPALELSGTLGQVSEEQASNRLRLVAKLSRRAPQAGRLNEGAMPELFVAPIQALMQSVPSREQMGQLIRTLRTGQELEPEKLIVWLAEHGYNRLDQVEVPGDFAVRGGIVDVYIPGEFPEAGDQVGLTVRVDFFGDQIESIKVFDLDSLGSKATLESVQLVDLKGQLPETGDSTHFFNYLPDETVIVLWAPLEIAEQAKSYFDRLPDVKGIYPLEAVLRHASKLSRVELSQFGQGSIVGPSLVGRDVPTMRLPVGSLQKFETEAAKAITELAELAQTHDITVFCENPGELKRFNELLDQNAPGLRQRIDIPVAYLHRGFVWEETDTKRPIALVGHHELFHRYEQRRRVKKVIASRPVDSFLDLKVGDYVVHVAHGIAKFTGMQTIAKEGRSEEYLTLRFAENAALHVPASRINLIQKYVGGFHGHPPGSRASAAARGRRRRRRSPRPSWTWRRSCSTSRRHAPPRWALRSRRTRSGSASSRRNFRTTRRRTRSAAPTRSRRT